MRRVYYCAVHDNRAYLGSPPQATVKKCIALIEKEGLKNLDCSIGIGEIIGKEGNQYRIKVIKVIRGTGLDSKALAEGRITVYQKEWIRLGYELVRRGFIPQIDVDLTRVS